MIMNKRKYHPFKFILSRLSPPRITLEVNLQDSRLLLCSRDRSLLWGSRRFELGVAPVLFVSKLQTNFQRILSHHEPAPNCLIKAVLVSCNTAPLSTDKTLLDATSTSFLLQVTMADPVSSTSASKTVQKRKAKREAAATAVTDPDTAPLSIGEGAAGEPKVNGEAQESTYVKDVQR